MSKELKLYARARSLPRYFRSLLQDVPLAGRTVLDVGSGPGVASLYCVCRGASRATCLEPASDGSRDEPHEAFRYLASATGLEDRVELVPDSLEAYVARGGEPHDVILMQNCVNHFHEEKCSLLHVDEEARKDYRLLLAPLRSLVNAGGHVVLADVSRRSFFGDLGIPNPFARTIEPEKHQPPEVWIDLIEPLGFELVNVRWTPYDPLGPIGDLLTSRAASYFFRSHFAITLAAA